MDIYRAVFRHCEHVLRQDAAIGNYNKNIWLKFSNKLGRRSVTQLCRLINGNIMLQSERLDRTERQLHASVTRLVRLSKYADNVVFFIYELFQ